MQWYEFGTLKEYNSESNSKIGRKNKFFWFFVKQDINKRNSSLHKLKILLNIRVNQLVRNSKVLKRLSRTLSA